MSLISPLADDLVLVYPRLAPVRLLELLAERGIDVVEVRTRSSSRWGRTCSRSGRGSRSRSSNDETRRRMEAGVEVLLYKGDEIAERATAVRPA